MAEHPRRHFGGPEMLSEVDSDDRFSTVFELLQFNYFVDLAGIFQPA